MPMEEITRTHTKYKILNLITNKLVSLVGAQITFNFTTPNKLTVAFLNSFTDHCLIATATTENTASIRTMAGPIANSSPCSKYLQPVRKIRFFSYRYILYFMSENAG